MAKRRVVITGLGLVTPLGCNVQSVWSRLLQGHCGVVSLKGRTHGPTGDTFDGISSQVAALVPTPATASEALPDVFDAASMFSKSDERKWSPFVQYAMYAANQALQDAKWAPTSAHQLERTGVCIGSGMGCIDDIVSASRSSSDTPHASYRKLSPYFVPRMLINMASGNLSIQHGFRGPNHAVSTACTTGAHAIGDAMRFIQYGDADVMVAGGTEASVSPIAMAGFAKARSLATAFNDSPEKASRPFDRDRDGFVIGEGAGVVVLEELTHAQTRGAKIYAEIKGYGLTGDAYHMTSPPPSGDGATRAMQRAISVSHIDPTHVDYVNAHATSTVAGDLVEAEAILRVFGEGVMVSSCKGALGHLLGAAGAVEAIATIMAVYSNMVPPTLNLTTLDPDISRHAITHIRTPMHDTATTSRRCGEGTGIRFAVTNSFGFGGTNASLCFGKL